MRSRTRDLRRPSDERNVMGNKPHQHPHQNEQRAGRFTRLLVAIFMIAIFALALVLSATGHAFFGRR